MSRRVFSLVLASLVTIGFSWALPGHCWSGEPLPKPVRPQGSPKELVVYPSAVALTGPRDEHRLIVVGLWPNGRQWELTGEAKYTAEKAGIVRISSEGLVTPAGDGETAIVIEALGQKARVPVTVTQAQADIPVSFSREIIPILSKGGCNGGGCHGSQFGKGGFKLSLFSFDPSFDHAQITQSHEGRRLVLTDPDRSILLAKPALVIDHAGGERLKLMGRDYLRVRQWIADGVPAPQSNDPVVRGLEVYPPARVMVPGEEQQLVVVAEWSDGRREDVTATALFDALSDAVAKVTPLGRVTAQGQGETHIMVRFGGQATIASIRLPFAQLSNYPSFEANNFIDEKLLAKWKELGLTPSPLCTDDEFLRRLYLDAIGTLPTPDEVRAFLADSQPDKRSRAIEAVLNRPEFVDWWALKWGDLLRINRQALQDKGMWSFHNWVRAQLRENKPLDEFVRGIVMAEGSTFTEGPTNFYRVGRTKEDWTEAAVQVFLGIRIGCAKCHNHPFEKWTQNDYYGMAAFFARLGTKNSQEFGLFGQETVIYLRPTGESQNPRTGQVVPPRPIDGPVMDDEFDRRRKLAEWLTSGDNLMFSRNIVNRFWGYLMGRGLVEPLDDMRATNPPSNPELLDALAKDFAAHKFDLKHLLRTIFSSRAYQLSSESTDGNRADAANVHFTRYTIKRLTAEQLADAIDAATGTREKYPGLPLGTRAIQLPDSDVKSYLMDTFGRPARQILCECDRSTKPNIAQALHLLNGDFLNRKIADPKGRVERLAKGDLAKAIDELFLATWSRPPTPDEAAKVAGWVKSAPSVKDGLQDLLWVLLNGREFLFNR